MKIIFIAGPFRAATPWLIEQHVRRAETLALEVWKLGVACICPHTNTRHFQDSAPDGLWLAGALEMLRRCDAVLCVDGWSESQGALDELAEAGRCGIPVFRTLYTLDAWIRSGAKIRKQGKAHANPQT